VIVIAMQAWFFLTPVMYEKEKLLRKKVSWLVALNPVAPLIDLFRSPLHLAALPHWQDIYNAVGFSILSVAFGLFLFSKQEKKIIFKL
jgi:ABC-type polysaccharide/polyol phosphate export permease